MWLKTSNGEKSNLLAYVRFCVCEKKKKKKKKKNNSQKNENVLKKKK